MKIRDKVYFIYLFVIIFLIFLFFVTIKIFVQAEDAINKAESVNNMLVDLFELNIVTGDYLVHKNDRALQQWNTKYNKLKEDLINHGRVRMVNGLTHNDEENFILNQIGINYVEVGQIFSQVSAGGISKNLEDILSGQISVKMQQIVSGAFDIFSESNQGIKTAKDIAFLLIIMILLIIFIIITTVVLMIRNSISRPLKILTQQVDTISHGNLGFKIDEKILNSKDEMGMLANSFHLMTKKLKISYEELENKVIMRTLELDKAKAQAEAMLENIGEGLVFVDEKANIEFLNRAGEKMLGINRKKVIGRAWIEVAKVRGEDLEIAKREILPITLTLKAPLSSPAIISKSFYYTRRNGNIFPVAINASKVILKNKTIGAIVVFRDISVEKEVDKAKTEFVSLASHQLRTPLTGIRWNTEILARGRTGLMTIKQRRIIKEIQKANIRMLELINTLLNVSRLETGTFIVEPEEANIVELAKEIVSEFKITIRKRNLNLTFTFSKDLPDKMALDNQLIQMIFQNLLSNAIKYTPENGNIKLEISYLKKGKNINGEKVDDNSVLLQVSDDGMGIPENEQSNVFSKLFRASNVKIAGTEGTGLGLYIIKTIIDNVGGKIWFKSGENKGTTFFIALPAKGMKAKGGTKKLE